MPAFTFEKISPPARPASVLRNERTERGGVVQILGRFVETRANRESPDRSNQTQSPNGNFDRREQTLPK